MNKPEETNRLPRAVEEKTPRFGSCKVHGWSRCRHSCPSGSKRRKALRIEVSQRTFDAVKANPSELKLLAKDVHGNAVIERPARPRTGPISESEVGSSGI